MKTSMELFKKEKQPSHTLCEKVLIAVLGRIIFDVLKFLFFKIF